MLASALAQRGKALRIKEREIRRSRCETAASWTSIARVCLSVRQDSLLFALFFERYGLVSARSRKRVRRETNAAERRRR
jgi:hypothetical protein